VLPPQSATPKGLPEPPEGRVAIPPAGLGPQAQMSGGRRGRRGAEHRHSQGTQSGMVIRDGRPYDPTWDAWRPPRRWPGVLFSFLAVIGLIAVLAHHKPVKKVVPVYVVPPHSVIQGSYIPYLSPHSKYLYHFAGLASVASLPLTVKNPTTIWTFGCQCSSNFGVTIRDANGEIISVPVNVIGKFFTSTVLLLAKGHYSIGVIGSGLWSISVINPVGLPSQPPTFSYLSNKSSMLGPFSGADHHLDMSVLAELGVVTEVVMYTESGGFLGSVFHTNTSTHSYVSLPSSRGRFFLVVQSSGLWHASVSP